MVNSSAGPELIHDSKWKSEDYYTDIKSVNYNKISFWICHLVQQL